MLTLRTLPAQTGFSQGAAATALLLAHMQRERHPLLSSIRGAVLVRVWGRRFLAGGLIFAHQSPAAVQHPGGGPGACAGWATGPLDPMTAGAFLPRGEEYAPLT